MKDYQTEKCIVCGNKANRWTGHVHKDKKMITAGFCANWDCKVIYEYHEKDPVKYCHYKSGCFGKYKKKYGKIIEEIIN